MAERHEEEDSAPRDGFPGWVRVLAWGWVAVVLLTAAARVAGLSALDAALRLPM